VGSGWSEVDVDELEKSLNASIDTQVPPDFLLSDFLTRSISYQHIDFTIPQFAAHKSGNFEMWVRVRSTMLVDTH